MPRVSPEKKIIDRLIIYYLKIKAGLYSLLHLKGVEQIRKLKQQHKGIQLKMAELLKIIHAIEEFQECRLLIFGLGMTPPFGVRSIIRDRLFSWKTKSTGSKKSPMIFLNWRHTGSRIQTTSLNGRSSLINRKNLKWNFPLRSQIINGM